MVKWGFLFILFVIPDLVLGQIRVDGLFSDHMVLQRGEPILIYGTACPKEKVSISFRSIEISCKANAKGEWKVTLPAEEAGGPYSLAIKTKDDSLRFRDVMVGEIWLASGQSNMEHPMEGWKWLPHSDIYRSEEEIADSDYPQIRLFTVPKYPSSKEVAQVPEGEWKIASPDHVRDFSSTAWFFAKELHNRLKVPVGIINCSWGGTSIHTWESKEVLTRFKDAVHFKGTPFIPRRQEVMDALAANWERRCLIAAPENEQINVISGLPDSAWSSVDLFGKNRFPEIVWLKRTVEVPGPGSIGPLSFSLGYLNRHSIVYFNGEKVGEYQYPEPVMGLIPRHLVCPGTNTLIVRVGIPFGSAGVEGDKERYFISLKEDSFQEDLSRGWSVTIQDPVPKVKPEYQNLQGALFNGMVNPCLRHIIKGVIWYQGENDVALPELYAEMFKGLILDWRQKWNKPSLPFLYVQISVLPDVHPEKNAVRDQKFRDYQQVRLPNTGMIRSVDMGDPYDVHPRNKKVVGQRLAEEALRLVY